LKIGVCTVEDGRTCRGAVKREQVASQGVLMLCAGQEVDMHVPFKERAAKMPETIYNK
jgi:hypothetical protein